MRIKKGFCLRPLGNEYILLAEGAEIVNFNKMLSLNESAAFLYRSVESREFDAQVLTDLLTQEYDVSADQAYADVCVLVEKWQNSGIIE